MSNLVNSLPMAITVPKEYGYVVTTAIGTCWLAFWHGVRIGGFRKMSGMGYPKALADSGDMAAAKDPEQKKALYLFNCAQRAHGNYLENHPSIMAAILIAGTQYPLWATGLGVAWMVNRVIYAVGYTMPSKTKGEGRLYGAGQYISTFGLYGLATWVGIKMVL